MSVLSRKCLDDLSSNDEECNDYLVRNHVFYPTMECPTCGRGMEKMNTKKVFRCLNMSCNNREISLRKGTFFMGAGCRVLK